MTTVQEDYALARGAAREQDAQRQHSLYLNRLNLERFRCYGISTQELQRIMETETRALIITANALEQLIKDMMKDC